jgi:parallel beta-helix repeat protein
MKIRSVSRRAILPALIVSSVWGTAISQRVQPPGADPASGICLPSQIRGNDVGTKINACDAKLGTGKGTIRLTGGGTIATPVVISPNHTLQVVSGTYAATNNGAVIRLKDNSSLICDSWDSVLQESTGKSDEGGVKPFTIVTVYNGTTRDAPNGSLARHVVVKGCHFKGARSDFDSTSQTVSLSNCQNCSATNNWLDATRTIGIQIGGAAALGNYADNVIIAKNLLTNVASQNLAIVNSSNVQMIDNIIRAPGAPGGPGVVPIDIEPNVGDRILNIKIANNMIDMTKTTIDASGAKGLHGIAINNLNQAKPFAGIEVTGNTIYGGDLKDIYNHVSGGLILARSAQNTLISNNTLRRGTYGILIDSGSSGLKVIGNQLTSCGSGSTEPIRILDSWDNEIFDNKLWNDPANIHDFSKVSRNIIEMGASDNNVFRGNDAVIGITGRRSRKISLNPKYPISNSLAARANLRFSRLAHKTGG